MGRVPAIDALTAGDLLTLSEIQDLRRGLAVLMHEAAHWLLFPSQSANNRIGAWLCGYPIGTDLRSYRRRHHQHHRRTRAQHPSPRRAARSGSAFCATSAG